MMEWRLNQLRGEYMQHTGEHLSIRDIAARAGLAKNTVMSISQGRSQRPDLDTINALLTFFSEGLGRELDTCDLLRFSR